MNRKRGIHALTQKHESRGRPQGRAHSRAAELLASDWLPLPCRRTFFASTVGKSRHSAVRRAVRLPWWPGAWFHSYRLRLNGVAESEFAFRLATDPRYLGPIRSNFKRIAEKINEVFYDGAPHYTRTSLKIALRSERRRGHSAAESPAAPEISFADELTRNPAYQLPARIKAAEIARKVNEEYHGGRPVRNPFTISDAIQRYRRQSKGSATE